MVVVLGEIINPDVVGLPAAVPFPRPELAENAVVRHLCPVRRERAPAAAGERELRREARRSTGDLEELPLEIVPLYPPRAIDDVLVVLPRHHDVVRPHPVGIETIGTNPQTYVDYRQLLERKDIDAILICTPLNLHTRMTIDALAAGKHVFVEKSMFFKEEEGEQIRQAAVAHPKQVLQVGLQRRSSVLYNVAMEMIRKGALGKITFVRAHWHRNSDWRRPVPDPKFERLLNWRMYREYSGGLMAELASHQIDVANWAIGAEPMLTALPSTAVMMSPPGAGAPVVSRLPPLSPAFSAGLPVITDTT